MFLPESPVWLASKNKLAQAQRAREWLKLEKCGRNTNTEKGESPQTAVDNSSDDESQSWKVLFSRPILMPMLIGLTLLLIQQVSGIDAVIFFTVDIFRSSGNLFANKFFICSHKTVNTFTLHAIFFVGSSIDGNLATIIVGFVQLASNVLSLFVVDRSGRKPLLIASASIMCVSMAFMGVAFHLNAIGNHDYGYVPLVSLIVFMIGFSIGFGSIPFLLMGEIFPAKQRGMLSSIAISFNVGAMFIVIKMYQPLEEVNSQIT